MVTILDRDWKFLKQDIAAASQVEFDDSAWRTVRVPHDYAIEGPFSAENDVHQREVVQDQIMKPIVHIGRTGGLPITDHAWYRRTFTVLDTAKHIFLEFDGVMSRSEIYVNGVRCGGRTYGYSSFSVDITEYCTAGENTLAVACKPKPQASRWYTGAGIYRNVRLVEKESAYFPYQAGFIIPTIDGNIGKVECNLDVCNFGEEYMLQYRILNQDGTVVKKATAISDEAKHTTMLQLNGFVKWNVYDSYLYTLEVDLLKDGKCCDTYATRFGFRTIEFDANRGMFVNGKKIKMNGVCMHHDLGALGAAVNYSATLRQVEKLKAIGANAIRTAHNPASPELIEICDKMGMMVLEESYDEWKMDKTDNGYGTIFDECAEEDMRSMVRRDRNYPCIIMWSIGNEVLEERLRNGWQWARHLSAICKQEDRTRLVTMGVPMPWESLKNGLMEYIDVLGINYRPQMYAKFHAECPNMPIFGSETGSASSSRGHYYLPDGKCEVAGKKWDDLQVNGFGLDCPANGYNAEKEFFIQDKHDFVCGEFVWTGFDYIGEPTPYRLEWPSRSSYFGIYDLAGLEKDLCYSYKSKWTNQDVVHLFPHWNWNEGDVVDVHCYSNYDEVELFVNGESVGISVKILDDEILRHRHVWKGIPYQAGEITAVAVRNPRVHDTIRTAGEVAKIVVEPEKTVIAADGDEMVYCVCTAVDANGVVCPNADHRLNFTVTGAGEYIASDAGDASSVRTFSEPYCELFHGKCVVIVRSVKGVCGTIEVTANADGVLAATATVCAESCA